ncbi:Replication protein A 32 kDa subunit, putative [Pediculus humanus corporis]|uniref:Replication protein A 32 kDa subunit, putative n=1 Tax=Pediculus humanus subsp. corporis TaxID=121224 RepID=E0VJR9_PEDHC|nr:Replication protein A 32 kDa subunit, putative [Pediculus humanus corporis]EEB13625.1 Replication protein A 32 kDa subunit, putative [Pediculus humanus corporis]
MDQWSDNRGGYFVGNEPTTPNQSVSSAIRQQFLCPVTVRQVLEAPEQGLKVGSLTATMVSLCGVVSNVEITSTTIKFSLTDDTGIIDCLEWLETQDNSKISKTTNLLENNYYHVYGCVKYPQGSRRIMVFKTVKVTDFNEITAFMLEVLSTNEYAEKTTKDSKVPATNAFGQNSFTSFNISTDDRNKLTPIQKAIMDAISGGQDMNQG